ncbi:hypothetical protein IPH19_03100 [Candidatus Uhrbacteria bacterium]|jgi:hypothetical protein|nr:MAG: hypothetical protein IPH19_03100 [Candidatus Uhrbacteria bacterium]
MKAHSHRSPPKRQSAHDAGYMMRDHERILSHEEKHELIRAHAATRHKRPRGYGLGYYIAVAASCLIVATGWVMTLDRGLWQPAREPDQAMEEFTRNAEKIKQEIDQTNIKLEQARKQFQAATASSTK